MANARVMHRRMRQSTRVLANEIRYYRQRQHAYGHDKKDDVRQPGELLAAAMEYIKLADLQLKTRKPFAMEEEARQRRANGWGFYSTYGGAEYGIDSFPGGYGTKRPEGLPVDIPWQPQNLKRNIYQACAFLLAELQKLEREEIKEENAHKPYVIPEDVDAMAMVQNVGVASYASSSQPQVNWGATAAVNTAASPFVLQPRNVQPMPQAVSCP